VARPRAPADAMPRFAGLAWSQTSEACPRGGAPAAAPPPRPTTVFDVFAQLNAAQERARWTQMSPGAASNSQRSASPPPLTARPPPCQPDTWTRINHSHHKSPEPTPFESQSLALPPLFASSQSQPPPRRFASSQSQPPPRRPQLSQPQIAYQPNRPSAQRSLLTPASGSQARPSAPPRAPAAAAAVAPAPAPSYAVLHRRFSNLSVHTPQTLASQFSKNELVFILRRHRILSSFHRKKSELTAELMDLVRSGGLSRPDDAAQDEQGVARVTVAGASSAAVGLGSSYDPDETQAPDGWVAPPRPTSRGAAPLPHRTAIASAGLGTGAGITRGLRQAFAAPEESQTERQTPSADEPETDEQMDQPEIILPLLPPRPATITLSLPEQDLVARMKREGARAVLWPNFDALYLDFSRLPRSTQPPASAPQPPAASKAAGTRTAAAAQRACSPSSVRAVSSSAQRAREEVRRASPSRAPTPKRARHQSGTATAITPDEVAELIGKAQRLVRGVSDHEAASALAATEYNLGRALSALRECAALKQQRLAASAAPHALPTFCGGLGESEFESCPRLAVASPWQPRGSLDLHMFDPDDGSSDTTDNSPLCDLGGAASLFEGQGSIAGEDDAWESQTYGAEEVGWIVETEPEEEHDGSETEWDYGPDGANAPP